MRVKMVMWVMMVIVTSQAHVPGSASDDPAPMDVEPVDNVPVLIQRIARLMVNAARTGATAYGWTMARWMEWCSRWTTWSWSIYCARSSSFSAREWYDYFRNHPEVLDLTAADWAEWWVDPRNWGE